MLANERVMTIAASSPAGETSVTSAPVASGLSPRHVTARVGMPGRAHPLRDRDRLRRRARARDDDDRAAPPTSTPSGRRISSDSGAASTGRRSEARATAATAWAR